MVTAPGSPARDFTHSEAGTPEARWRESPEWDHAVRVGRPAETGVRRLIVVAAHPDDETLGAGGLIHQTARDGREVVVVLLTDGEGSHPGSPSTSPDDLARLRVEESRAALRRLAPDGTLQRLGLPDGSVHDHADAVVTALVDVVGEDGGSTLLVAPWRADGHSDHDAAGRAAAVAAWRTDATLWEYPVWLWHWCEPAQAPWADLQVLPLPDEARAAKDAAVALHRTQVAPLSDAAGDEAVLHDGMLEHFRRDVEVYLRLGPVRDDTLERLHDSADDPWEVRTSWYEQRKRNVTLAALPRRRYSRALEVGGSVGALAAELSRRCDRLTVVDESASATRAARQLLDSADGVGAVSVEQRRVPEEWPDGRFDLVVVSEVGYFLSPKRLRQLVARVEASLDEDGAVVLCHWRHPVRGWPLDGARVHEIWRDASRTPVVVTHVEDDFRLDVLSRTAAHRAGSS
ncbi:hypothetical protein GCM10009721_03360 [Terrabacter tumescens]|uniref:LmbE family N-acetylglucosaminyl deacetylase n=1 Tax=Terrabacter tumescens TaxID=60443 RepID=A0ABQ2HJG6_9MICO|nr:bifunctional PIG-L family deacetylase/class I SAM-dependent methyltransferase [Terrabacter tumescens]GGM82217.1 hypothetical protein GCM10009721_03360 [Terrabacter tumescens]